MPFVILDRDGVINYDSNNYIKSPEEWHPIPGSLEAITRLNKNGFTVIIATNQSGITRGYYDINTLHQIHHELIQALAQLGGWIDDIFFCPHHPDENCNCRKPQPGMLDQIQAKYACRLSETFFIGDSITDIQAAQARGCQPILVLTGKGQKTLAHYPNLAASISVCHNLSQAVEYILSGDIALDHK